MRHTPHTYVALLTLVSILMLTGFGCRGLSQDEQAAIRPITLNYWTVYGDVPALRQLAAQYKQIRPYVTINVRQVRPDTFDQTFVEALADDVGPDIVSIDIRNLAEHQHRLAPMPNSVQVANISVEGTVRKDTVVDIVTNPMPTTQQIRQQYITTVSDNAIVDGNVYGLPLAVNTMALYYNRTLLDRAGVAQPPATWEELQSAVEDSTIFNNAGDIVQSGIALGTGSNIENSFDIVSLLMLQNGVTMAQGSRVTFANGLERSNTAHPSIQALQFYTDFAQPTRAVYSWNTEFRSAFDSFVRGQSVFYFGFASEYDDIVAAAPQMDLATIPVPQLNFEQPVTVAQFSLEAVVEKSTHKDEAWDFIRFLSSPERILSYATTLGQPSPLRTHVSSQRTDEALGPFADSVLTAVNWYRGRDEMAATQAIDALVRDFVTQAPEGTTQEQYSAQLINRAAQIVQQTF